MVKNILVTIRHIRIFQNISQQNIADFLEITQSSYAKIERGESRLSVDVMLKLCAYLSVNPSFLIDQAERKEKGTHTIASEFETLARELSKKA